MFAGFANLVARRRSENKEKGPSQQPAALQTWRSATSRHVTWPRLVLCGWYSYVIKCSALGGMLHSMHARASWRVMLIPLEAQTLICGLTLFRVSRCERKLCLSKRKPAFTTGSPDRLLRGSRTDSYYSLTLTAPLQTAVTHMARTSLASRWHSPARHGAIKPRGSPFWPLAGNFSNLYFTQPAHKTIAGSCVRLCVM